MLLRVVEECLLCVHSFRTMNVHGCSTSFQFQIPEFCALSWPVWLASGAFNIRKPPLALGRWTVKLYSNCCCCRDTCQSFAMVHLWCGIWLSNILYNNIEMVHSNLTSYSVESWVKCFCMSFWVVCIPMDVIFVICSSFNFSQSHIVVPWFSVGVSICVCVCVVIFNGVHFNWFLEGIFIVLAAPAWPGILQCD